MISLDQLVRKIEPAHYKSRADGHYIFNPKDGSFKRKVPKLFSGRLRYYEVACSKAATPNASGTIGPVEVLEPSSGKLLHVVADYDAWILRENAQDLLRALAGQHPQDEPNVEPGRQLVELVLGLIRRCVSADIGAFASDLPERVTALTRDLERQVLKECGLSLFLTLRLEEAQLNYAPEPQRIEVDEPILLADYRSELRVRVLVVIYVRKQDQALAIDAMSRRLDLREMIQKTCRDFFLDVDIARFRRELGGALPQELLRRIEKELSPWHLRLRGLNIHCKLPDVVEFSEEEMAFLTKIRNHPREVQIHTRLHLQLKDEAQYHRSGAPVLKMWVEKTVRSIAQRILFETRYSQVCVDFSRSEALVLEDLQVAAQGIGYVARALVMTPELPERRFHDAFLLSVSGEFATAVDIVSSHIEIVLRLRLEKLQSVARELDHGEDLEVAFKQVVLHETSVYLHTTQPDYLFTHLNQPRDQVGRFAPATFVAENNSRLVEDELRERIERALATRYGLRVLSFAVKLGRSQIRDCYLALIREPQLRFHVNVQLRGHGGPVMHYGAVRVVGVDEQGWQRFQQVLPSIEDATRFAQDAMSTLIGEAHASNGLGISEATAHRIAEGKLPQEMRRLHGLRVELVAWHRDRTAAEGALDVAQNKSVHETLLREIEEQRERRGRVTELEKTERKQRLLGQGEEADRIETKLRELREQQRGASATNVLTLPWEQNDTAMIPRVPFEEEARDVVHPKTAKPRPGVDANLLHRFYEAEISVSPALGFESNTSLRGPLEKEVNEAVLLRVADPTWQPHPGISFLISSRIGNIVSGRGTHEALRALMDDEGVLAIEASRDGGHGECHISVSAIRANVVHAPPASETGDRALIALIDDGIDVLHEAFRDANGKTRILAYWDQFDPTGASPASGPHLPSPYGTLHDQDKIDGYIAAGTVPPALAADPGVHGTHVASIAAGRATATFGGGVAPDAKIVVVRARQEANPRDPASLGYSLRHVDALSFIKHIAVQAVLPVVVNVSQGMNAGAHDGTSALELAFDAFSGSGRDPGLAVVKSAGNDRKSGLHAKFSMVENQLEVLSWHHPGAAKPLSMSIVDHVELWFKSSNEYAFWLESPGDHCTTPIVSLSTPKVSCSLTGGNMCWLNYERYHHDNGDSRLLIKVSAGTATAVERGAWRLHVLGKVVRANEVHAWAERRDVDRLEFIDHRSEEMTLSIPGTAQTVICVGAAAAPFPLRVAEFSACGPTRDGRAKPDLLAPGTQIRAAQAGTADGAHLNSGTSMSAPHVAGAVALAFSLQAKQQGQYQLNARQIQAALTQTVRGYGNMWAHSAGFGFIDVAEFILRAVRMQPPSPPHTPAMAPAGLPFAAS